MNKLIGVLGTGMIVAFTFLAQPAFAKTYTVNQIDGICSDRAETKTLKEFKKRFAKMIWNTYGEIVSWKAYNTGRDQDLYIIAKDIIVGDEEYDYYVYGEAVYNMYKSLLAQNEFMISRHWENFVSAKSKKMYKYESKKYDICIDKFKYKYRVGMIDIAN